MKTWLPFAELIHQFQLIFKGTDRNFIPWNKKLTKQQVLIWWNRPKWLDYAFWACMCCVSLQDDSHFQPLICTIHVHSNVADMSESMPTQAWWRQPTDMLLTESIASPWPRRTYVRWLGQRLVSDVIATIAVWRGGHCYQDSANILLTTMPTARPKLSPVCQQRSAFGMLKASPHATAHQYNHQHAGWHAGGRT
jgi:hypothetical protein